MDSTLAPIFLHESVDDVRRREQTALEELLALRQRRVVLVGAGTLGKRAHSLLGEIGCQVLAFTDNNAAIWGTRIDDTPVLPPAQAASLYGVGPLSRDHLERPPLVRRDSCAASRPRLHPDLDLCAVILEIPWQLLAASASE